MRTARPSGKAVLVAGALALTLVVGAGSGAIAGKLITSQDIQDGTIHARDLADNSVKNRNIGHGQVNWQKSLSKPTKQRILDLVQAGPAGPQGEPGAAGPQGQPGPPGPPGAPGTSLTDSDFFGASGFEPAVVDGTDFTQINGATADSLFVPTAGTYLITVRGVVPVLGGPGDFPYIYVGDPFDGTGNPTLHTFSGDCELSITALIDDLGACASAFTLTADGPTELPVTILGDYGACTAAEMGDPGCEISPFYAQVAIYRMSTAIASSLPGDIPCGCRGTDRRPSQIQQQLRRQLERSFGKLG